MSRLVPIEVAERINTQVNESVTYKDDMAQYGKPEWWSLAGGCGDCEDYALLKRHLLREEGYGEHVHMVACVTEEGEGHAVVLVDTPLGFRVLDNRFPYIMEKSQLPNYKWVSIEIQNGEGDSSWHGLK